MKEQHDRKGIEQHAYSSSDLVWFNVRNLGLRHNSRRHKLLPKYWGPFKVVRLVGRNAVELDMPTHLRRIHPVVSTSLVKKYKHRDGHSLPPAVSDLPDKEEYEVDSIQDFNIVTHKRHGVADVVEFRLRWKGSLEDTWHEPADLANALDVLVAYLQKLTKSDRIKVLKLFDLPTLDRLPASMRALITDAAE